MAITMMLMPTVVTSLGVSAETLIEDGLSNHDVYATYNPLADADITYKVDVEWGSMEFTYDSGDTKSWSVDTLKYDITTGTPMNIGCTLLHQKVLCWLVQNFALMEIAWCTWIL